MSIPGLTTLAAQISAVPGLRFTFTVAQEHRLRCIHEKAIDNLRKKPVGWRVFAVQHVNATNRIIKEALDVYHGTEAEAARS